MSATDDSQHSAPELDEDASIQSEVTDSDDSIEEDAIDFTNKRSKDAMGISAQSIEIVGLKGGDDDSVRLNDLEAPKRQDSMKCPKLPWLDASISGRSGQDRSLSAHGMSVGSGMTGMDASFATMNFDAASIETDNVSVRSHDPADNEETNDEDLEEDFADQGINLTIEVNYDEHSLGETSELSIGNQSYILDLAGQKEARERHLKEEVLEEAVILYKEGKKEGHRGRSFFLMILTEVRKKKLETKKQHYKLQDERLDRALVDELRRRKQLAEGLSGASTHSTGQGRRSERVDNFIERENERKRRTLKTTPSAPGQSDVKIEMHEDGEYVWGDGNDSDEESPHGSKVVKQKKKKKNSTTKKSKKGKEEKPARKSSKPKKNKSNLSSDGMSDFEDSQVSGKSGRKERKAGGSRPKKNKSNMSAEGMSDFEGSQVSVKSAGRERKHGSTTPKKHKSNVSSEGMSDFDDSQYSGKKEKKTSETKRKKKSSKQARDEADLPQKTKKSKKSQTKKKSKKGKAADKTFKEKEDESPPETTEASEAVEELGDIDNGIALDTPNAIQEADETVLNDSNGVTKTEQTWNNSSPENEAQYARSDTTLRTRMERLAAKATRIQPTRKLSGMLSSMLGKNKDSSTATAKERPKAGGFFRRKKSQDGSVPADPGD